MDDCVLVMTRSHPLFVPTVTNTCQDMIAEEPLYTAEIYTSVNTLKKCKDRPTYTAFSHVLKRIKVCLEERPPCSSESCSQS